MVVQESPPSLGKVWEGGFRFLGIKRETVRSEIAIPSLSNSRECEARPNTGWRPPSAGLTLGAPNSLAADLPLSAGNSGPIDSEPFPLPTDDGVSVHQAQSPPPRGPDSREHYPEQSIFPPQSRNSLAPLQHCQLLAKG